MCISRKRYHLDYDGQKDFYQGAQDTYPAGATVRLHFDFIATDTDYSFYLDDEPLRPSWKEEKFTFIFKMPDHDAKIHYKAVNTMHMDRGQMEDSE